MKRDRVMRLIIFFDLPHVYNNDIRNYNRFRKFLINEGFIMMQESVYSKLALNSVQINLIMKKVIKNSPDKGIIEGLVVTERQYANINYIVGHPISKIIDSEDRMIVL